MKQSSLRKKILLNTEDDRKKSKEFIDNISSYLGGNVVSGEEFSKIMMSAAKLMEVNAKSNERIVKIFETIRRYKPKKIDTPNDTLTAEEVNQILSGEVVET